MFGSTWGGATFGGYPGFPGSNNPLVQNWFTPGQNMLATVQNAMQVFSRFSGMLEETMRNLHLVFDSIFGLVQILGLLKQVSSDGLLSMVYDRIDGRCDG